MKETKANNLNIECMPAKIGIRTPENLYTLNQLVGVFGVRNTGKSTLITNLVKHYMQSGCIHRVILVSSTADSNRAMINTLKIKEEDIIDPLNFSSRETVQIIKDKVEEERHLFDQFHLAKSKYASFKKKFDKEKFIDEDLCLFYPFNFDKPTHYLNGARCGIYVIIDDSQGLNLLQSKELMQLSLTHRHLSPSETHDFSFGLSIAFLCQSYISQGGLNRTIRTNLTNLFVFKSNNKKELDSLIAECSAETKPEEFNEFYEYATIEPHSFLSVDFFPK